ncbi:MAG: hypothetical protein ABH834_06070 [Candidatus Altiarchaeota archaeon]
MTQEEQKKMGVNEEGEIIVLLIPDEDYTRRVMEITKDLTRISTRLCYISLNLPYRSLLKHFDEKHIDPSKFYFIDAITQTAEMIKNQPTCEYVSSPGALTELSLAISNILETQKFDYLIFDSLSTLLVYESPLIVTKFIHSLMAKIRVVGTKAIFTCLKQDYDSVLLKDINMFADKILNIEYWGRGK